MKKLLYFFIGMMLFWSCRDKYIPQITNNDIKVLIVEGSIEAGRESMIRLTYSTPVSELNHHYIPNAVVTLKNESGTILGQMRYRDLGHFVMPNTPVSNAYIVTIEANGDVYTSKPIQRLTTPEIDSVTWQQDASGVNLYVSTNDPSDNTKFYKWDYDETWEYHSRFVSDFVYEKATNSVRDRIKPDEDITICYANAKSTQIKILTTEKLSTSVIKNEFIHRIDYPDERLSIKYSFLVTQQALDKEAYTFYQILKRNTQDLGGLFNSLPSELGSNFSHPDPEKRVVGYVVAANRTQKRIFIHNADLDKWRYFENCSDYVVPNMKDSLAFYFGSGSLIPYGAEYKNSPIPSGYYGAVPYCVDCKVKGGTKTKPSFW